MKKYLLFCLVLCMTVVAFAQDTEEQASPWSCTGVVGLNASATGLVNWAAGGNNNLNGVAFGKVRLLYSENDLSWETNLNLEDNVAIRSTWKRFDHIQHKRRRSYIKKL